MRNKITLSLAEIDRRIQEAEQALDQLRAVRAFTSAELHKEEAAPAASTPRGGLHSSGWPRAVHEVMLASRGAKLRVGDMVERVQRAHPNLTAADPNALVRATLNRLGKVYGYQKEEIGRETLWWLPVEAGSEGPMP